MNCLLFGDIHHFKSMPSSTLHCNLALNPRLNRSAGCRYEAVNTSVVSQHYRERQQRCVSPPVVENEQPRGRSMQIQFQRRVNSLYWGALIKLPRLFVYSELHANTMQMQKNQTPDAGFKARRRLARLTKDSLQT